MRAPQFFRTDTGHRVVRKPLAAPITPQISFMQESFSTLDPFTLVTALLFARPTGLTRPAGLYVPAGPLGLLLPGFQVARSPRAPAGYHYEAKLRNASAGLCTRKHSS